MFRLRVLAGVLVVLGGVAPSTAHAKVTKGPWVQRVGPSSAVVRVEVNPSAAVKLETIGGASPAAFESRDVKALHEIALEGLTPATHYSYAVTSGGDTVKASFSTSLPDDSSAEFRFLAYGDNRTDDAAHASVVRAMVPVPGDFIIHTGDFVENGASLPQWQTFFDIEAPLLRSRPIVSAVGNHELTDGSGVQYVKLFAPAGATKPEHLDHTFRWGNTRFFLLNGIARFKTGDTERLWLDRVLDEADDEPGIVWRVVVVHHGPWSSGPHGGNPRFHDAGLPALFLRHKVDVVLSGHDHTYERGLGEGLPFVVTGGGGAPLYRLRSRIPQSRYSESTHHFVQAEVSPRLFTLTAIRPDGSRIERCSLSKDAEGWFCGEAVSLSPDGGSLAIVGDPEKAPNPPPPSRCSCAAVGAAGASPYAASCLAAVLVAYVRRRRRY